MCASTTFPGLRRFTPTKIKRRIPVPSDIEIAQEAELKPITQVAEEVGVHETTVSRAISGKYMATPHGIFEMKYFFTSGYETETGESMSNTSVKSALAEVVRAENPKQPLSDEKLVQKLKVQGISIARRTVAKYREELNILPSHLRKTY